LRECGGLSGQNGACHPLPRQRIYKIRECHTSPCRCRRPFGVFPASSLLLSFAPGHLVLWLLRQAVGIFIGQMSHPRPISRAGARFRDGSALVDPACPSSRILAGDRSRSPPVSGVWVPFFALRMVLHAGRPLATEGRDLALPPGSATKNRAARASRVEWVVFGPRPAGCESLVGRLAIVREIWPLAPSKRCPTRALKKPMCVP